MTRKKTRALAKPRPKKQHDMRAISLLRMRLDCLGRARYLALKGSEAAQGARIALEQMAAVYKSEATLLRKMR
jgi:hypothetical protein